MFTEDEIFKWITTAAEKLQAGIKSGDFNLLSYGEEQQKPIQNITVNVAKPPDGKTNDDIAREIAERVNKAFD
jgi:hypothetical protein